MRVISAYHRSVNEIFALLGRWQHRLVVTDVSGQPIGPMFKGQRGPLGCPETSAPIYQSAPRNIPRKGKISIGDVFIVLTELFFDTYSYENVRRHRLLRKANCTCHSIQLPAGKGEEGYNPSGKDSALRHYKAGCSEKQQLLRQSGRSMGSLSISKGDKACTFNSSRQHRFMA